jgi:hypothetical protein
MKPVAWMRRDGDRILRLTPEPVWDTDEPLYVAPKPIPEDELWKIFKQHTNGLDYARAIEEYHGIK